MGRVEHQSWKSVAVLGLWGAGLMALGAMTAAWGAPPAGAGQRPLPHLDLHPSVTAIAAFEKAAAEKSVADRGFTVFPSPQHRQALAVESELQLPELGAYRPQARVPSRMEEFARRVHKEGLPVARLWENKSALVSLGLNQKGKPGLWIVQKVH
jgi:hypothetical protein